MKIKILNKILNKPKGVVNNKSTENTVENNLLIKKYIKCGLDVNTKDYFWNYYTLFDYAIMNKNFELTEYITRINKERKENE